MIKKILQIQNQELDDILMLKSWLPPIIFDSHVHTAFAKPKFDIINNDATTPGETFNYFDWSLHSKMIKMIFPNQKYLVATFGFPYSPRWKEDNNYIAQLALQDDRITPIFLAAANTNLNNVKNSLDSKFMGLKMYATKKQKKKSTKIIDVFPANMLKINNHLAKPIILHLPNGLLKNLEELIVLARTYPQVQFIVAHMGTTYCYESEFDTAMNLIRKQANIFLDTAMVSDSCVIAKTLEIVGPKKILFGSDAPFSYFRGGYVINPVGKRRLYTQLNFNWVKYNDRQYYQDQVDNLKLAHINIILAIKEALGVLTPKSQNNAKNNIFYHNSKMLFKR